MIINNLRRYALIVSAVLVIASCGTTEPMISESDILSAERNGTLQSLYAQVRNGQGLGQSLNGTDKATYLRKIGGRLAGQAAQKISAILNDNRLPSNEVPLSVIHEQSGKSASIQGWDSVQYQNISDLLSKEETTTTKAITISQARFDVIEPQLVEQKYAQLSMLKALHGSARQAELAQFEEQLLSDAYDHIDQLVVRKDFTQAITQLKRLVNVAPDYRDVSSKLGDLENTALQETFIRYVTDGETAKAHEMLALLAKGPYFADQKGNIMPYAMELANYYITMGVDATGEEDLASAYRLFTQARSVKSLFGIQGTEVTQESDFIDFIYERYEESNNKKSYGLAMGYLYVIEALRPHFPDLETNQRLSYDNVMNNAVKRVSTTAFNGEDNVRSIGRSISSKITQYVFDTLPNDVRVVEREHLGAVLKEQEINALQQGSGVQIDSADLLIQGTVLEANVETNESKGRKVQRVVTERNTVNNPEYPLWEEMSSSERSRIPKPSRTKVIEKKEDIGINVTYIRKVAILSISYRVVDATSASVLFADSVLEKKEVADEGADGVQLGEFSSPFKIASLPSNTELLSELAVTLSKRIGAKVVELLKDPEIEYQRLGEKLFDERNFVAASEALAKALVMSQSKSKDTATLEQTLREYAVAARLSE
ncbi:MAG: curli biogenesis system outer membrane secretion channel CsgG [Alteromonadaceae bacterium]|jgi:curli biogenesis system outer membrane secretion channel CsgG